MSDLISRSQLLKEIETWGGCVDALHDYIQNMPTAYDVDKVVEELEELKERIITNDYDGCETIGCPYPYIDCDRCQQIIVSNKAIEIVKAGGDNGCE